MRNRGKVLFALLAMTMLLFWCSASAVAETLILPSELKVIEEEAFCGNTSLDKVIIPEGTVEIQSKAFADSSLKEIVLPESLTKIAEDAFEDTPDVKAQVPEGSYAETWCHDNNVSVVGEERDPPGT